MNNPVLSELDIDPATTNVSVLERSTVRILERIPGLRGLTPSRRVVTAVRGGTWTLIGYGGGQVLRFVTQLALAHVLLSPAAFGLVALASVFISGLELLSDLGIGMDVVQHRRGDESSFINTAFLIQAVRGTLLFIIAAILAGPFAAFYRQPEIRALAVVAALSILIRGFAGGSIWRWTRHVKIKQLTILNLAGDVAGLVVSLVWVFISPTAWALVINRVVSAAVYTVGSHLFGEEPTRLRWDSQAAREILAFGTGVFLGSATYFLSGEAERLIIGKYITVAELGCFSLALAMASAPSQALSQVAGQVFYPMIARSAREDEAMATRDFRKARTVFLALSLLLAVGFIVCGPLAVAFLLPPKFEMAGWMLQWLGFRAAQQVFVAPTSSLLYAHGNTRYSAAANLVRLVLMVGGLWWAFSRFGIHEAIAVLAISGTLSYLVLVPGLLRYQPKIVRYELAGFCALLLTSGVAAFLTAPLHLVR